MKKSFTLASAFMLSSTASLALVGAIGKYGGHLFPLQTLIFGRYLVSFLFLLPLFLAIKELKRGVFQNLGLNFARAFFLLGAQYSFFYYIQNGSLLNAATLLNTGPIFIPLIEWIFLKKKVPQKTWVGIFLCFLGALCILQPSKEIFSPTLFIGLLAGLCQGISQTLFGITSQKEKPYSTLLSLFFFSALLSGIPFLFFPTEIPLKTYFSEKNLALFLAIGAATLSNQFFRAAAYAHERPSHLAFFLYFTVLVSGGLDAVIWHHYPNIFSLIGVSLLIVGGLFATKKT